MSPPDMLRTGDRVEVSSDDDGFHGAFFEARVVRSMPNLRRYTVEYDTLVDDSDPSRHLRETVDTRNVRPRPPRDLPEAGEGFVLYQPVDAFYKEAWWLGVVSAAPKGRRSRYRVCFPANREEMEFGADELRAHLEWVKGKWILPESGVQTSSYSPGAQVEVARLKGNSPVAWFPAVVVMFIWKNSFLVEYMSVKKSGDKNFPREIVDLQHIRPCPLHNPVANFDELDEVEAFYQNGWWPGVITKVNSEPCYTVKSLHWNKEKQFDHTKLRHCYDFVDGQWIQKSQNMLSTDIEEGKMVEVCSDEEGFSGAWFTATVLKLARKDNFLVQYHNLKTDDETELLTETVDPKHIRPIPPKIFPVDKYDYLEEVDAFHNDGWWVGVVSEVLSTGRYRVYFSTWREVIEFGHDDLRFHQDWINGRWDNTFMRAGTALNYVLIYN